MGKKVCWEHSVAVGGGVERPVEEGAQWWMEGVVEENLKQGGCLHQEGEREKKEL
jgi:hypothetical protein